MEICSETNFGIFYNTYYQRFVRYAFYYVNSWPVAENMTHDALLYYWENRLKLSPDIDVLGYILQTVKSKCLNYLKHLQIERDYDKQHTELHEWEITIRIQTLSDDSYSSIFTKDIMAIVKKALDELPVQTRKIFIMNRLENKTRKDIAQLLDVSLQTIDYHINKANNHLLSRLKDYIPLFILFFN